MVCNTLTANLIKFGWIISLRDRNVVASWLVRSTLDRAVLVRALAGNIVTVFFGQDTLLLQCLAPPMCINSYRHIKRWGGEP